MAALERLSVEEEGRVDEGNRAPRLPRWTRQEILVLIQGKKMAENRVRSGGRTAGLVMVEPKWASVSSYCKRHGVNRGPVQCRKRWSNLAGDFKKIKEWESSSSSTESFWVMRNDLRRERKLPGFFDKEVYDILDGGAEVVAGQSEVLALALAPPARSKAEEEVEIEGEEDGLFEDFEQQQKGGQDDEPPAPSVSEKQYEPISGESPTAEVQAHRPPQGGTTQAKHSSQQQPPPPPHADNTNSTEELGGKRRKRNAREEAGEEDRLIEAMELNRRILSTQLEAQNVNIMLDREQRKDHVNDLLAVLNKLADAMVQIADKL